MGYMNTTYKAFVAETAAKIAASIAGSQTSEHGIGFLTSEYIANQITGVSVSVAEKLAYHLQEWWQAKGDEVTVMFDVQDSPTSRMENELSELSNILDAVAALKQPIVNLYEAINGIEEEMEREFDQQ